MQRLPHCQLDRLPKIWNSAPALPFLSWLPMMWHEFRSALLLCQFFIRCEVPLPHFRPALAVNNLKFSFRTSALPGHLKVWSFASALPLCLYYQRSEVPLSVLLLVQDFEIPRSSSSLVLPGLPNMGKSISAFHLCRDFQRCEVPLPHFCSAITVTDLKFRFGSSVLPLYPKMWSSASALLLCLDCQRCDCLLPQFHHTFLLCIPTQFYTVFRETSQAKSKSSNWFYC